MIQITTRQWKNYQTNNSIKPDWTKNTQVSTCPGLMNYVTEGLVVLCPDDFEFETADGKLIHWSATSENNLIPHYYWQADIVNPGHTIVKFDTGIMLKHVEEHRLFCLLSDYEPMNPAIKVMPAVFPLLDVWSPVMMNTVWRDGIHKVKKGDPLARIFLSYYGDFEYEYAGETNYLKQAEEWLKLKEEPNILTAFNKEMKKCPFHHG